MSPYPSHRNRGHAPAAVRIGVGAGLVALASGFTALGLGALDSHRCSPSSAEVCPITVTKTWADFSQPDWGWLKPVLPSPSTTATGAMAVMSDGETGRAARLG